MNTTFDGPSMAYCKNTECSKLFVPAHGSTGSFCSKSCAAKVNNRMRRSIKECSSLECTKELTGSQKKYCSVTCQQVNQVLTLRNQWLLGEIDGGDKNGELRDTFRKYLINLAKHECTECGWGEPNPVTGQVILTIDHKDGNWKNNAVDNLVVLCYNCHTLTSTFGVLNRGTVAGRRTVGTRRH